MNNKINTTDKQFSEAEEKALSYLQDREYTMLGRGLTNAGAALGRGFQRTGKGLGSISSRLGSIKDAFNVERRDKRRKQSKGLDRRDKTMMATKAGGNFDRVKERNKTIDNIKGSNMHRKVGGTAVGAVAGGAIGTGVGSLVSGGTKKKIAFLESKDELNNRETAELAKLKGKLSRNKVIGGVIGTAAGALGGYHVGSKLAEKNAKKLKYDYKNRLGKAVGVYNSGTRKKKRA